MHAVFHFQSDTLAFADPTETITASTVDEVLPALAAVERATSKGHWAAGFVAYEAAPAFDPAMRVRSGSTLPLLQFGIFGGPLEDNASVDPGSPSHRNGKGAGVRVGDWSAGVFPRDYASAVDRIRSAIAEGYTYQVNYTLRMETSFDGDDYAYWQSLCRSQGAGYAAYLDLDRFHLLSASPELFFQRNGDRIVTRPMKGTSKRGRWIEEDVERREWLRTSEKNRAENLMIVDLLRNDLGRIASTGSVKVDELFRIEPYPTVFQMTSQISATLRPNTSLVDIFRALFPCGSVTGAPKISTMSLIADLEPQPRGAYCGAIGYVAPGGDAVFNVGIRTVTIDRERKRAVYGTGGGITWDSDPVDEYHEAISKAAILTEEWPDFDLLETLALHNGDYALLDRHLDRLTSSARYFNFRIDIARVRTALDACAADHSTGGFRVRLLVSADGSLRVEGAPLGAPRASAKVAVADTPIDSGNRFLYHKTTNRSIYDCYRREHPDAFDTLLWNERGEATEFTIGNLVVEIDGKRYTPPVDCGLLPGTMRAELLENGEVEERVLHVHDLENADQVWLINSVRGWVPVTLS